MSKEGSLDAPIRHPIDFEHPDFLNPEKLDLIFQDLKNQDAQSLSGVE